MCKCLFDDQCNTVLCNASSRSFSQLANKLSTKECSEICKILSISNNTHICI